MLILKKQDITELPLKEFGSLTLQELETWCESNKLDRFSGWLLPQLVARIGSWTLVRRESHIDVEATFRQACESLENRGLWQLTRVTRSLLIKNQVREPDYAAFTPLVLLAFRRIQGVQYSAWQGLDNLKWVLEPLLYECCSLGSEQISVLNNLTPTRILEIRNQGLTPRTGKSLLPKKPESTWRLFHIDDTEMAILPVRTQTMVAQCWLAHPANRRDTMILDPLNWDKLPEPIVTAEVFKPKEVIPVVHPKHLEEKAPW